MRIKSLLIAIMLLCVTAASAAPFKNVERILTQPDGTKLYCFASGDEFYNRLHDADGFTIVQAENGYFVYATADSKGAIMATNHIAGKADPKALGLKPNIVISQEEYQRKRDLMKAPAVGDAKNLNHGVYNNIVIFIKFKGDGDFNTTKTEIDSMFNYNGYYDISMNNYFAKATYNQLSMMSYCYPIADGDRLLAYEDIYERDYYRPYNEITNPIGYLEEDRADREFALLKRAVDYIADEVPADLDIDRDNDGNVDNVVFVVKGNVGDWSDLLWPHMWSLYGEDAYINGKKVYTFNFQLETSSYFSVSTLCHEMSHSLGFPDLYHYYGGTNLSPAGPWDLMCGNAHPPQHSGTYMKYKYGTWIEKIPEIGYGTYTIEANSWEGGRRNCYKIPSSHPDQYYLVEYRNKENLFEKGLPSGGLLIYRIDTRFHGCADYNGSDQLDEVYIFRPGGTHSKDGYINSAAFSKDNDRVMFNCDTDPYPFLNKKETDFEFNICNISEMGNQMTFTYCPIDFEMIPQNLEVSVNHGDNLVELEWDVVDDADSYNVYRNGAFVANVSENHFKDDYSAFGLGYHQYQVTAQYGSEESFYSDKKYVITGGYSEYVFDLQSSGDYGWQGGEIRLSFDNEMEDVYITMYSNEEPEKRILVPEGVKMTLSWLKGWDDTECSFSVKNGDENVYVSSELQEGVLTEIIATDSKSCVAPYKLKAVVNDNAVELSWKVMVESDSFTILRNDEVIAQNITECNFVDEEIQVSGVYEYVVKSMNDNCVSMPSEACSVFVIKNIYSSIQANASLEDNSVVLNWDAPLSSGFFKYDDGEYVTNIGSNTYNWGIKISANDMKQYAGSKLSHIEMFDACKTKYTFKIYNGEKINDNTLIHTFEYEAQNAHEFVKIAVGEIPFDANEDLWITAKSVGAFSAPVPCSKYTGNDNGSYIKAGGYWVPAVGYNMNYTWMLRAYTSNDTIDNVKYNIYRNDELLASDLTKSTYIDSSADGKVCYEVKAFLNEKLVSQSDTLCVEVESYSKTKVYPNPVRDVLTVKAKDVVNVKIISITGAVAYDEDTNDALCEIDMNKFESGLYIVQITTKTETITEKIVKY